jgi:hypothetical protein
MGARLKPLADDYDAGSQMIDTAIILVRQCGASITSNRKHSTGRTLGGLTSKIDTAVDSNGLWAELALPARKGHDIRLTGTLRSRLKSGPRLLASRPYDADAIGAVAATRNPRYSPPAGGDARRISLYISFEPIA